MAGETPAARRRTRPALKFDARTAERLSGLLDGLTGPEELDRVGGWIIECENGRELLSRVSALRTPAGSIGRHGR